MADLEMRPKEKISSAYPRVSNEMEAPIIASLSDFYAGVRQIAIPALMEEGYERSDIVNTLDSEDLFFRMMPAEERDKELSRFIPENFIGKETGLSASSIYRDAFDDKAVSFFDITRPQDLKAICNLLDSGYPVTDIVATQADHAIASKYYRGKSLNQYFDSVWSEVNQARTVMAGRKMEAVRAAYVAKAKADMYQYKTMNGEKKEFSLFQDGRIVVSLLVLNHFDPEVVEAVIAESSFNPKRSPEYAHELVSQAMEVKKAYDAIERIKVPSDARTIGDAFRFYSNEYMTRRNSHLLSPSDEQAILRRMASSRVPNNKIEAAFAEASPVSLEPGRSRDAYIQNSIKRFHDNFESRKAFSIQQYPKTKEDYEQRVKSMTEELSSRHFDINHNRSYYDCLIALDLLKLHHSPYNISKVISELSPQATKNTNNPNKTPLSYANWIVNKAKSVLCREQDILRSSRDAENLRKLSLPMLFASNFSIADLYCAEAKKLAEDQSSARFRMTDSNVDRRVCESLLTKHADIVLDDLAEALKSASPRAELAGVSQSYAVKCIEGVQKKLQEANEESAFRRSVEAEFNRQRGLEMNGIAEYGGSAFLAQSLGHIAMELKNRGLKDYELRESLLNASSDIAKPEQFVDQILNHVQEISKRQKQIVDFQPSASNSVADEYLLFAQGIYKDVNAYQTSDDIDFVKSQMLTRPDRNIDEINQMLLDYSPIAAEPGRDEHYVEYIQERAKDRITIEEEKLRIYHPEPRTVGKCKDCYDEYMFHRDSLHRNVSLPYDERMDIYIAETLLLQGYPEHDVTNAVSRSSLSHGRKDYGLKIVQQVKDRLDDDIDYKIIFDKANGKQEDLINERVMVRTIDTSYKSSSDDEN